MWFPILLKIAIQDGKARTDSSVISMAIGFGKDQ